MSKLPISLVASACSENGVADPSVIVMVVPGLAWNIKSIDARHLGDALIRVASEAERLAGHAYSIEDSDFDVAYALTAKE